MIESSMRKEAVTEHDLKEALRSIAKTNNLSDIKDAYLERSGEFSFIIKQ